MPKFAADLCMTCPALPSLDRLGAATRDGFAAVEIQFACACEPGDSGGRPAAHGPGFVLFNLRPGGASRGPRWLRPCR